MTAFLATLDSNLVAVVQNKTAEYDGMVPKLFGLASNIYEQYAAKLKGTKAKKVSEKFEFAFFTFKDQRFQSVARAFEL